MAVPNLGQRYPCQNQFTALKCMLFGTQLLFIIIVQSTPPKVEEILWILNTVLGRQPRPKSEQRRCLTKHFSVDTLLTSTFSFISLADTQCTYELNRSSKTGMLMKAEVRREKEWEQHTSHTWFQLVDSH